MGMAGELSQELLQDVLWNGLFIMPEALEGPASWRRQLWTGWLSGLLWYKLALYVYAGIAEGHSKALSIPPACPSSVFRLAKTHG